MEQTTYSANSSTVNPPINSTFGGIVNILATTYENVTKARLAASNPPKNPPPGSFGYSPQNDTKDRVTNPAPGTLPPVSASVVSMSATGWLWVGVGFVLLMLFGWRAARS